MMKQMLRSKIHKAIVTEADLSYVGSITIDEQLMELAGLLEYEKVLVVDNTNGSRLETYVISGTRGSGQICMNGAAAHLIKKRDEKKDSGRRHGSRRDRGRDRDLGRDKDRDKAKGRGKARHRNKDKKEASGKQRGGIRVPGRDKGKDKFKKRDIEKAARQIKLEMKKGGEKSDSDPAEEPIPVDPVPEGSPAEEKLPDDEFSSDFPLE